MTQNGMMATVVLLVCLTLFAWGTSCCVEVWTLWVPGTITGGIGLTGCALVVYSNRL